MGLCQAPNRLETNQSIKSVAYEDMSMLGSSAKVSMAAVMIPNHKQKMRDRSLTIGMTQQYAVLPVVGLYRLAMQDLHKQRSLLGGNAGS